VHTGVLETLDARPSTSAHAVSDTPGEAGEDDVEVQRAHVWRSLCRRALWRYAGGRADSPSSATGEVPPAAATAPPRSIGALQALRRLLGRTAAGAGEFQDVEATEGPVPAPAAGRSLSAAEGSTASDDKIVAHLPRLAPERLALHRSSKSCWLAADGKVYDATLFLQRHPAGAEVILKYAGSDCSEDLALHSAAARALWAHYLIGVLKDDGKFLGRGLVGKGGSEPL
jgi:predicted heme/steroid binding protein